VTQRRTVRSSTAQFGRDFDDSMSRPVDSADAAVQLRRHSSCRAALERMRLRALWRNQCGDTSLPSTRALCGSEHETLDRRRMQVWATAAAGWKQGCISIGVWRNRSSSRHIVDGNSTVLVFYPLRTPSPAAVRPRLQVAPLEVGVLRRASPAMYKQPQQDLVTAIGLEHQHAMDVGLRQDPLGERVFWLALHPQRQR